MAHPCSSTQSRNGPAPSPGLPCAGNTLLGQGQGRCSPEESKTPWGSAGLAESRATRSSSLLPPGGFPGERRLPAAPGASPGFCGPSLGHRHHLPTASYQGTVEGNSSRRDRPLCCWPQGPSYVSALGAAWGQAGPEHPPWTAPLGSGTWRGTCILSVCASSCTEAPAVLGQRLAPLGRGPLPTEQRAGNRVHSWNMGLGPGTPWGRCFLRTLRA